MQGGEKILRKTSPRKKADWMREAMLRMNKLLDLKTRKTVREACACRLTGQPLKASRRRIARENKSLEDRIKAANKAIAVFGGCARMQENGDILMRFAPEGLDHYHCACLRGADKPLPVTYCFCCGGHVKYQSPDLSRPGSGLHHPFHRPFQRWQVALYVQPPDKRLGQ